MASSAHVDVSRDKLDESPNMVLSPALIRLRNDWLGRSDLLGLGSPNSDEGDDELGRNEDISACLPTAPLFFNGPRMMFDVLYLMHDSMIHDSRKIKQKLNLKPHYIRTYGRGGFNFNFLKS